jgi:hypothetical protein
MTYVLAKPLAASGSSLAGPSRRLAASHPEHRQDQPVIRIAVQVEADTLTDTLTSGNRWKPADGSIAKHQKFLGENTVGTGTDGSQPFF